MVTIFYKLKYRKTKKKRTETKPKFRLNTPPLRFTKTPYNLFITRGMSALRAKYYFIVVNYYFSDDIVN